MSGAIESLHQQYVNGTASPVAQAEQHLAAAASLGRDLNAFTAVLGETALAEAEASYQRYRQERPLSALDGVPISVKDLMHVRNTVTGAGSYAYPAVKQSRDANIIKKLHRAGAVIIGKTNLLEFAFGLVHPEVGPAQNPWDRDLTIGGSSSGSAAAVAAGIGYGSIGTDTAGSIRNPAALGGVAGYKPTYGHYSAEGLIPLSPSLDHIGWLARSAADLVTLYEALGGRPPLQQKRPRIAYLDLGYTQPEVKALVDARVNQMAREVEVAESFAFDWELSNAAAITIISAEAHAVHRELLTERWSGYSAGTRVRLLAGAGISAADYMRALQIRATLKKEWRRLTKDADFVLLPTLPGVAGSEEEALVEDLSAATLYTSTFALLGLPTVSIPAGLNSQGRPAGLQIAGNWGQDAEVLAFAALVESRSEPMPKPPYYAGLY